MTETSPLPADRFADLLRRTRRLNEDSQEHLANLVGMKQATLSRVEAGKLQPPPEAMRGLARYLGLSVEVARRMVERDALQRQEAELTVRIGRVRQRLNAFSVR